MVEKTRRNVLRTATVGVIGTTSIATVSGRETNKKEERILRTARKKFSEGKPDQARKLLEKSDLKYASTTGTPANGDQVSTQDRYASPGENSNTEINLAVCQTIYDDKFDVYIDWELNEESAWISTNNVCPPDGAAIYWNKNYWQPDGVGRDNFKGAWTDTEHTGGFNTGHGDASVEYEEYDADGGILAEIDAPHPDPDDGKNATFRGGYYITIKKVKYNAENYPIKGKYVHSWKDGKCLSGFDITLNAGVIGFSGGDPDTWSMATQASP